MRVSAYSVLANPEQREQFLALLSEYKIRSKPKSVTRTRGYKFIEFQLPNKWQEHEIRNFLEALESLSETA